MHALIAQSSHKLHWHQKLLNAYRFHRECASNQNDGFAQMVLNLKVDEPIILFDWKENLTLLLANVETGDMFWANSRKDASVLGVAVWQYHCKRNCGESVLQKSVVAYASGILDRTSLASDMLITKASERNVYGT